MIRADKVAVYIRWSTDDQERGTTLSVQKEGCSHYVLSQGWQVREELIFVDDGYSGASLDRPAMTRLRELVKRGEVDCIVVYKTDRLSRNIVDATNLVLGEWRDKCYLKMVLEPIDTTTELGRMIFSILAMFADFERNQIKIRTQSGKIKKMSSGEQMHGKNPFGYLRHPEKKGVLIENPEEIPLLRRIYQMAVEGMSANGIVKTLNREGLRTRAGKEWTIRAVLWILHNERYIGTAEYGRTSLVPIPGEPGKKKRVYHQEPKVRKEETPAVPILIDRETFDVVQRNLTDRRARKYDVGGRAMGSPHLLVGISKCICGSAMIHKGLSGRRRSAYEYANNKGYYICSRTRLGMCTENGHIPSQAADGMVEQYFLQIFGLNNLQDSIFAPYLGENADQKRQIEQALRNAVKELNRLLEEDQQILRDARAGKIPYSHLDDLRNSVQKDREDLEIRVMALKRTLDERNTAELSIRATMTALDAVDRWETLEVWQKRQLISIVLDGKITIQKKKGTSDIAVDVPFAFH